MSALPTPTAQVMHIELPERHVNVLYPVYSTNPAIPNNRGIEAFLRAISGYTEPDTFKTLSLIMQNELYRFSLDYDESYPNTAKVLVFRDTASPNTRTMTKATAPSMGHVLRLLGRKNSHVVMPVPDTDVNTLVVAYPIEVVDGVHITSKTPMVFIGLFKSVARLLPAAINEAIVKEQLDTAAAVWEYEPHAHTIDQLKTALRTLMQAVEAWKSRALAAEARVQAAEARAEAAEATNTLLVEAMANARHALAVQMAALDAVLNDFTQPNVPKV